MEFTCNFLKFNLKMGFSLNRAYLAIDILASEKYFQNYVLRFSRHYHLITQFCRFLPRIFNYIFSNTVPQNPFIKDEAKGASGLCTESELRRFDNSPPVPESRPQPLRGLPQHLLNATTAPLQLDYLGSTSPRISPSVSKILRVNFNCDAVPPRFMTDRPIRIQKPGPVTKQSGYTTVQFCSVFTCKP